MPSPSLSPRFRGENQDSVVRCFLGQWTWSYCMVLNASSASLQPRAACPSPQIDNSSNQKAPEVVDLSTSPICKKRSKQSSNKPTPSQRPPNARATLDQQRHHTRPRAADKYWLYGEGRRVKAVATGWLRGRLSTAKHRRTGLTLRRAAHTWAACA